MGVEDFIDTNCTFWFTRSVWQSPLTDPTHQQVLTSWHIHRRLKTWEYDYIKDHQSFGPLCSGTLCLNMTVIVDSPWLVQKLKNEKPHLDLNQSGRFFKRPQSIIITTESLGRHSSPTCCFVIRHNLTIIAFLSITSHCADILISLSGELQHSGAKQETHDYLQTYPEPLRKKKCLVAQFVPF